MNKTMQNRFGGVPTAHNGNTKTRFFRKPFGMLLLLAALVMAGGKAWGQTTFWWLNGVPQTSNRIPASNWGYGGDVTVTIANGTTVYIDGQIGILSDSQVRTVTIKPETGGTCTIKRGNEPNFMFFVIGQNGLGSPHMPGYLKIESGVTIDGNSGAGSPKRSCIIVAATGRCDLSGVTIQKNYDHVCGGGINNAGEVHCTDCIFKDLIGTYAGAVYNNDLCNMYLTNCTFSNNFGNHGGAITNYGTLIISGGSFSGNYTNDTNGGAIENSKNTGVLNVTGTTFSSNHAQVNGGAIYNDSGASLLSTLLTSCTFSGNYAQVGGAIFNSTTMNIAGAAGTESTFTGNYATNASNGGGAIYNGGSSLACSYCIFKGNHAASVAGAIQNASGKVLSCTLCTFGDTPSADKNYAVQGGAIYNAGTASFQGCSFTNNNSSASSGLAGGGAIANRGTLTCQDDSGTGTHCTFTSNTAKDGGGIYNFNSSVCTLTNCVFTSNVATAGSDGGNGGAIIHANTAQLAATGCTFTGNNSSDNGGAIFSVSYSSTNPCNLTSCVFNTNHAKTGGAIYSHESLNVDRCTFDGNYVSGGPKLGGAIFYGGTTSEHNKSASIKGSTFLNNEAQSGWGGAIYADKTSSGFDKCNMTIQSTTVGGTTYTPTFHDNEATNGGGIYVGNGCSLTMSASDIYKNTASNYGGGVYVTSGGTLSMSAGSIGKSGTGNANTANKGGGVYVAGGTFNLSGGNVQYNTTSGSNNYGSGIYLASGSVSMTGGKVNNNTGATQGGGVYVAGGTFGLSSNGEIISNSAGAGGGVYQAGGTFNQSGGYIGKSGYRNEATSQGGAGLYLNSGTFNLSSGDIAYNTASAGPGGGVRLAGGTLAMSGGQIVNNTAGGTGGGGVFKGTGDNTILRVTGTPVIKDNEFSGRKDDVFLNNATANYRHILIGDAGLQCGAEIGVFKTIAGDYYKIAEAEGSNAAANANYAMRNGFFFDDQNSKNVGSSTSSPYYNVSSSVLYLVSGTAPAWSQPTQPSGYSVSGTTITISTAAGLAYMAYQVNSGADTYSGKTVLLNADINLSGNKWVPIGYMTECDRDPSAPEGFKGTFDGQGHTIYNVDCDHPFYDNAGLFGIVRGGTVKNLMVSGAITNASANLGGIVGEMIGGSVYNCMSSVTPSGGSNRGALVGKITSGSVKNCYAISDVAAAGSGTVTNCYVRKASGGTSANMGTATNVGSGTTGTFTATQTPYLYKHADNRVGSTPLLTLLNQWVDGQSSPADLAHWSRTMASPINGDYPILMMPGMTCVGTKSGSDVLNYGSSLNTMLGTHNALGDNIYFWGTEGTVASPMTASNTNANVYFAENAAIIHSGSITKAHVGITVDNTNGSAGVHWHMFSPALSNAPLGINYTDNNDWSFSLGHPSGMPYYLFNQKSESSATYGYFPSHEYNTTYPSSDASATSYYPDWDFYCYYEPEYHWINFKRNGNSHHHEDLDPSHPHINYQATPTATTNENESTLIKGKGYLVATAQPTLLEAKGTLNQGTFTIAVTKDSPTYRTGFNFLGNPYLSYFDFDEFADENKALWGGTKTNASYIILDKDGYTYYAYSGSANLITTSANRYLHPHQGFMIVATNAGTASFTNDMRSTTGADFRDEQVNYPLVNLIVTEDDGNRDITTIELGRPEVGGAFKYYDLRIGKGCLYTHYEDQDYAIAFTLPGIDQVSVRFETDEDATYTMTWDMENGEFSYLHLIDNITGSDIDCLQAREYRFSSKTTDFKSRFKLMFGYTGVEEQEDGPSTGSGTFAFIMGNELVVNCGPSTPSAGSGTSGTATLQMFDMTGRQVMSTTVSGTQTTTMLPNVTAGVYVLRLSDRINGTRTQKIVIE